MLLAYGSTVLFFFCRFFFCPAGVKKNLHRVKNPLFAYVLSESRIMNQASPWCVVVLFNTRALVLIRWVE